MPESADLVLYWWHKSALLVRRGKAQRFGLITTNSLRQTFARRIVEMHLSPKGDPRSDGFASRLRSQPSAPSRDGKMPSLLAPISLLFAIPDHPWVDTEEGAAVRIAMTVGAAGEHEGTLMEVINEIPHEDGSAEVRFTPLKRGKIHPDLSVGASLTETLPLRANDGMTSMGVMLAGRGFVIEESEAIALGAGRNGALSQVLRPIRNGRDMLDECRKMWVIDFTGLTTEEARSAYPALFQIILTRVKPERDGNRDKLFRERWWLFGRSRQEFREMTKGLPRFVATVETAKHRIFEFLEAFILPEHSLIGFGTDDAFYLGVLSSRIHVVFALGSGGRLGVGNDPRYNKTRCLDPFPFPLCTEAEKEPIRKLAEELDAHRKRVQAQHPGLTLTGMYNVLEKLRSGEALTPKEKLIHDQGLVSLLKQLHDDLDAAVFAAYGWSDLWKTLQEGRLGTSHDLTTGTVTLAEHTPESFATAVGTTTRNVDAEILTRLVHLNAQRAADEKRGIIHWLRPDYQNPKARDTLTQDPLNLPDKKAPKAKTGTSKPESGKKRPQSSSKTPWPKSLADRIRATEAALHAAQSPVTATDLTQHFTRAKPHDIQEILESLAALGRARQDGERFGV